MAGQLAEVGDAVVREINRLSGRGEWPARINAERKYLHEFRLEDTADQFRLTLSPASRVVNKSSRGDYGQTLRFNVVLSKRTHDSENRSLDPLMETVELLQDAYSDNHQIMGPPGQVRTQSMALENAYDQVLLEEGNLFVALLVLDVLVYPR